MLVQDAILLDGGGDHGEGSAEWTQASAVVRDVVVVLLLATASVLFILLARGFFGIPRTIPVRLLRRFRLRRIIALLRRFVGRASLRRRLLFQQEPFSMDQRHGNISLLRIPRSCPRCRPSHCRPRYRHRHRRAWRRWQSSRSLSPLPSRRSSHLDLNPALQLTSPRHLPVVIVVTAIIVNRQKRGKGSPHRRCDDPQPAP